MRDKLQEIIARITWSVRSKNGKIKNANPLKPFKAKRNISEKKKENLSLFGKFPSLSNSIFSFLNRFIACQVASYATSCNMIFLLTHISADTIRIQSTETDKSKLKAMYNFEFPFYTFLLVSICFSLLFTQFFFQSIKLQTVPAITEKR